MPTLYNRHGYSLFSNVLGRELEAGERVEITDEQAAQVNASGVWTVEGYTPPAEDAEPEGDGQPAADAGTPPAPPAEKTTAQLGSDVVETDAPPAAETR